MKKSESLLFDIEFNSLFNSLQTYPAHVLALFMYSRTCFKRPPKGNLEMVSYSKWSLNKGVRSNDHGGCVWGRVGEKVFSGTISLLGHCYLHLVYTSTLPPPGWLSGEHVGLMT